MPPIVTMDIDSFYVETLAPEIAARYKEKLKLYCDNIDPYSLDVTQCSTAIDDLPNITTHQILSYLVLSKCPYSGMQGKRSLDYKNASKTGCVMQICVKNLEDISIVLGEVQMLETGEYLNPWFVSFPYGYVLCAHCTCSSGTNEMCIHIGGLLHKVHTLKLEAGMQDISSDFVYDFEETDTGDATTVIEHRHRHQQLHLQLPPTRFKRKKHRIKLYVCGICSAQFEDKNTFKEHCQQNHALPTLTHKDEHKRIQGSSLQNGGGDGVSTIVAADYIAENVVNLDASIENFDSVDAAAIVKAIVCQPPPLKPRPAIRNNPSGFKTIDNKVSIKEEPDLIIIDDDDDEDDEDDD